MNVTELNKKIDALHEWEALEEEAKAQAEAIRDEIKADMIEKEVEEIDTGKHIIRWTSIYNS